MERAGEFSTTGFEVGAQFAIRKDGAALWLEERRSYPEMAPIGMGGFCNIFYKSEVVYDNDARPIIYNSYRNGRYILHEASNAGIVVVTWGLGGN